MADPTPSSLPAADHNPRLDGAPDGGARGATATLKRPVDGAPLHLIARDQRRRIGESETQRVLQAELQARISGEVRFDDTSRMLYSTDASNYQIEPVGVVIPKTTEDVLATVELATSHGVPILARGGGSSLAGQAVGAALVIDYSKYLNRILEVNVEERTVTVEPGITLELLNNQLRANGLMFGPDPSSLDRATVGGVISNNASGAHSILYGMSGDHVVSARLALGAPGTVDIGPEPVGGYAARAAHDDPYGQLLTKLLAFRTAHHDAIERDFPRHWRRATGYSLNELTKPDGERNVARLLASAEGTLGAMLRATVSLVPTPTRTALVMLQFDDLVRAMEAVPILLESEPSAVELMDRMLIDLTRKQPGYARQIGLIHGDPAAVLVVEFYGDDNEDLARRCQRVEQLIRNRGIGLMTEPLRVLDPVTQKDVWTVRKAGLGLLMSIKGDYKPVPVIEDVSVPVEHLADYVRAILKLVEEHGTTAAFYAHASAGCLHVRPLLNLKSVEGVTAMRELGVAACELTTRFGGVMSGEHGDGLQRGELNERIFGPELYGAMRELKGIFDPRGLFNPGKIVDSPPMTENLRYGRDYRPMEPKTFLDFRAEGGLLGAVEMCNGAAVCRKLKAGTMCPSFMATKDEEDSTRGRANALRNALAGKVFEPKDFTSKKTYEVMDLCMSCKACKTECPSSVDMAKIKTEFTAQYQAVHGTPLRSRVFGHIHTLSKVSAPLAPLANLALKTPLASPVMRALGVHPNRKLPAFQRWTFPQVFADWRAQHPTAGRAFRGQVVYFHDTFATYNYPQIGLAAVRLLDAAGFEVILEERRVCCGRPMLSKGLVTDARRMARRNVTLLAPYAKRGIPVIGTEPSCILTLRDEYADLLPDDPDVGVLADNSFMIDEFLAKLAGAGDLGIDWLTRQGPEVLFHGHCHQKALIGISPSLGILRESGCRPRETGAGCCGMAGSFGYETEHYDVSRKIMEDRLLPAVMAASPETVVAVAGVSCRQQIEHFADQTPQHIAEVLADRIAPGHVWKPGAVVVVADSRAAD